MLVKFPNVKLVSGGWPSSVVNIVNEILDMDNYIKNISHIFLWFYISKQMISISVSVWNKLNALHQGYIYT